MAAFLDPVGPLLPAPQLSHLPSPQSPTWLPLPASHLSGGSQPSPQYHNVPTGLGPQVNGLTSGPVRLSFSVLNLFGDYIVVANSYPKIPPHSSTWRPGMTRQPAPDQGSVYSSFQGPRGGCSERVKASGSRARVRIGPRRPGNAAGQDRPQDLPWQARSGFLCLTALLILYVV